MLSSLLLERMKAPLNNDEYSIIENYINSFSYNTMVTVGDVSLSLPFDNNVIKEFLQALVDIEILQHNFFVQCPKCRLFIEPIDSVRDIAESIHCHGCGNEVEIDDTDVEDTFTLLPNSETIAGKFPDSYSLLAVDKKNEYGISQGRLLHTANSIEELSNFASSNGFDNELLHFITGDNLF